MKDDTKSVGEFNLGGVVPWGRRFAEYQAFFDLYDVERGTTILDVGGGPASFAAEACTQGFDVTAVDPIYALSGPAIQQRFDKTSAAMRHGMRLAAYRFNWAYYGSEEGVHRMRREALSIFLEDFNLRGARRYVPASLPHLPFADGSFALALSSHLLFLYGDELDVEFHIASMRELLRVAREVRIFPLVNLDGRPSSHLPEVVATLQRNGANTELVTVPFEFQIGATKMLKLSWGN